MRLELSCGLRNLISGFMNHWPTTGLVLILHEQIFSCGLFYVFCEQTMSVWIERQKTILWIFFLWLLWTKRQCGMYWANQVIDQFTLCLCEQTTSHVWGEGHTRGCWTWNQITLKARGVWKHWNCGFLQESFTKLKGSNVVVADMRMWSTGQQKHLMLAELILLQITLCLCLLPLEPQVKQRLVSVFTAALSLAHCRWLHLPSTELNLEKSNQVSDATEIYTYLWNSQQIEVYTTILVSTQVFSFIYNHHWE